MVETKCILVGTLYQNRRKVPEECKTKKKLHETDGLGMIAKRLSHRHPTGAKTKSVAILSSFHSDIPVSSNKNPKKKPDSDIVLQ